MIRSLRLAIALSVACLAAPALAQPALPPVPSQAQCDAKWQEAVAWRRAVFAARTADRPWLKDAMGPDDALWGEAGVQALACRLAASTTTTAAGPSYADGFKAGVAAAAARAASTPAP